MVEGYISTLSVDLNVSMIEYTEMNIPRRKLDIDWGHVRIFGGSNVNHVHVTSNRASAYL